MVMPAEDEDRPRVLLGVPTYKPRAGGSTTYFSTLVDKLKGKVEFLVYSTVHPEAPREEEEDGVKIYRIQPFLIDSPKIVRYLILPPVTWIQLRRLWKSHGPFIIHAHACGAYGYIISAFAERVGAPLIKEVQDLSDPAYNILKGNSFRYVATGKTIEKRLMEIGIEKGRIITYPSLNPDIPEEIIESIKPRPYRHPGKVKLLCVSALRPYKGVDILLEAMVRVNKIIKKEGGPEVELTIIGEGGMRPQLERFIEEHHLDNVHLRGFVDSYFELLKIMANSDILVLSSVSAEGNPRVILEAWQFSRPVIATAAGGTPELVRSGENGVLLPVKNPEALARAIVDLARNPEERERLGRAGRETLKGWPTWDDLARDIYSVYSELWKALKRGEWPRKPPR